MKILLEFGIIWVYLCGGVDLWLFGCGDDVDCQVKSWSPWTACSRSCGASGSQSRTRKIKTKPECDGDKCPPLLETKSCKRICCPVDCKFHWGAWGACRGCGVNATQKALPVVTTPQKCGGSCDKNAVKYRKCDSGICCPVNCAVGSWGAWGGCNAQCERQGSQSRRRSITTQKSCNGQSCPALTMSKPCVGGCCPRDCVFSQWSAWGKCSAAAGVCNVNGGTQTRSRSLRKGATCGGKCGVTTSSQRCTVTSVPCKLRNWASWGSCQPSNGKCGTGTRIRKRTIQIHPVCSAACATLTQTSNCMHSCCPVDCVYNQWKSWSACTNQCGKGMQTRSRTIKSQSSCNGVTCQQNLLRETKVCTQYVDVDCVLASWSSWSVCDNGCGRGKSLRTRKVVTTNKCRGQVCASLTGQKSCQSYRDRTDCVVSKWSSFGSCTENCSPGVRFRHRNITTQVVCGGQICPILMDSTACGVSNGGCAHVCNNGICSCRPGYDKIGSTSCTAKDCGTPLMSYCPSGEKARGACIYPSVSCQWLGSKYPSKCPLSCPTGYTLKGETKLLCQASGTWKPSQSYCKRDNEPPTDITLGGSLTVPENAGGGYLVGKLHTVDTNNDSFTYKLINAGGCNCFSIVSNSLKTLRSFDYEANQNTFQVTVQTIDNGIPHLNFTKTFQITVTDVNEKPTDINLSHKFIDENTDIDVVVGTLQAVDADRNQTYKYTILDNGGSNSGTDVFKIVGDKIVTAKSNKNCLTLNQPSQCPLNHEKSKTFNLVINAMDSGSPGLDVDKQVTIYVRNINDPPYNVQLSNADVLENAAPNTYIGTISATEEDKGQSLTFSLLDDDKGNFYINLATGKLYKTKPSNYESKLAHHIVAQVTDNGSPRMKASENFTINVIDINEPPLSVKFAPKQPFKVDNITLSVPEDTLQNTLLTDIIVRDRDTVSKVDIQLDDTHANTFSITAPTPQCVPVSDKTAEAKSVCTTTLRLDGRLNHEQKQQYELKIRVIDRGHSAVYYFKLNVTDVNDEPSDVRINGAKSIDVSENQKGVRIGKLETDDEDAGQLFQYQITSNDFGLFDTQSNYLVLKTYSQLNYEEKSQYFINITSTDDGKPAKSVSREIEINVIDANDPIRNVTLTKYTVTENTRANTVVSRLVIEDEDEDSPSYKTHTCFSHAGSYLDNTRHDVVINNGGAVIDYESFKLFDYTITCIDKNVRSIWTFEMEVVDENEAPESIALSNTTLAENTPPPLLIGKLSSQDPDNVNNQRQTFNYSLLNNKDRFQIIGDELYAIVPFDYEMESSVDVNIKVADSGNPAMTYSEIKTISVLNVNDQPSDILLSNDIIEENSPQFTIVGNLTTVDSDLSQAYTYRLLNDGKGRFEIHGNQLRVAQSNIDCLTKGGTFCALNFENTPTYQLTVVATDNGSPPQSITKNFTVNLRDINDRPRRISITNFTIHENQPVGTLIGELSAIDEDKGQTMTFDLIGGDMSHFVIEGIADLKIKTNFSDYETKRAYTLLVRVTDNGYDKLQHNEYMTIEVLDVNEPPIDITITDQGSDQTFNISNPHVAENTKIYTKVGTVYSYDEDFSASLVFSLDDDSNGTFSLEAGGNNCQNSSVGKFKVTCKSFLLVNKELDFEFQDTHQIILRVSDQHGLSRVQKFTVVVLDENDAPTDIVLNGNQITEGTKRAEVIGQLHTVDEDLGQKFDYEIEDQLLKRLFEIHNSRLYVKDNVRLDYETTSLYNLTVTSTDRRGAKAASKSITKSFQLIILDVNEAPNQIILNSSTVQENSPRGTFVSSVRVIDPDNAVNASRQTHNCSISQSSSSSLTLSQQGDLIVKEDGIDFEQTRTIQIDITCTDSGSPSLSYTQGFTITVKDVNERPIDIRLSSNDIMENTIGMIGDLRADDHDNFDGYISQTFEYQLINTTLPFTIRNSTLFSTQGLDYESKNVYALTIRVTDSGQPRLSLTKEVIINVIDVNEAASAIMLSSLKVAENSGKGTIIGKLSAIDEDRSKDGNQQQHQFFLTQNPLGLFRIDQFNQLEIAVDNTLCSQHGGKYCTLNFEDNRYIPIQIRTEDDGSPPKAFSQTFTIQLTDVNEPPTHLKLSNSFLRENATIGHVIGRFTFNDEDIGQTYNVSLSNDDNGRFRVDDQFNLVKAKATNYETQSKHVISVLVSDSGNPTLSATKTFKIFIQDVNESPTNLHISDKDASSTFILNQPLINENMPRGTIVGTIEAIDQDTVTDLLFSLVDDASGSFQLDKKITCQNVTSSNISHTACQVKLLSNAIFNFEDENQFNILIRVEDHAGLSHLSAFNISIRDRNDGPTNVTVEGELLCSVRENSVDEMIGELETIDEDETQQFVYELVEDAGNRFVVKNGLLGGFWLSTTSVPIDFEESANYTVVVKTTDNGNPPMSFQHSLTVQILNINEAPSDIFMSNYTVVENSPDKTTIGEILVDDPDNVPSNENPQSHLCTLTDNARNTFYLTNDKQLQVLDNTLLDYESSGGTIDIFIECKDTGFPSLSLKKKITIVVTDVNETPSKLILTSTSVPENSVNFHVGMLRAVDPDTRVPQNIQYELVKGTDSFSLYGMWLMTKVELDFETKNSYSVEVKATDYGGLSITQNFTINVEDRNDAPIGMICTTGFSIPETSKPGTTVGRCAAVDQDMSQIHFFTITNVVATGYNKSWTASYPESLFKVERTSGRVEQVTAQLDHETYDVYTITLKATDNGIPALSYQKDVTLQVTNVNQPPTDILLDNKRILENSPSGTVIGSVTIVDPDNKHKQIDGHTCIVESIDFDFKICPLTITADDKLVLVNPAKINYEYIPFHNIRINCTEDTTTDGFKIHREFRVDIVNVNEAPEDIKLVPSDINEHNQIGDMVGSLYFIDPDNLNFDSDTITVTSFKTNGAPFKLLPPYTVLATQELDHETATTYDIQITLTDNGTPHMSVTKNVTIKVNDLNDVPSDIKVSTTKIPEDTKPGDVVATLTSIDDDKGQQYTYMLLDNAGIFKLNGDQLILTSKLQYGVAKEVEIFLESTDNGQPPLSLQKPIKFTVTDSNDKPTSVLATAFAVPENTKSKYKVADVSVVDVDIGQSHTCQGLGALKDSIETQTETNGNISVYIIGSKVNIDYETNKIITVNLRCSDNGVPSYSIDASINIPVTDVNEPPTLIHIDNLKTIKVPENTEPDYVIGSVDCKDPDEKQVFTYSLEGHSDKYFKFLPNSPMLVVKNMSMNYEAPPGYDKIQVYIKVTDSGSPPLSHSGVLVIVAVDVNEPPQKITLLGKGVENVPENTTKGAHIAQLWAENPEGLKQELTFRIEPPSKKFEIVKTHSPAAHSFISLKEELDYDKQRVYHLLVRAEDNGQPSLSTTQTITLNVIPSDACALKTYKCPADRACQRENKNNYICTCNEGYEMINSTCEPTNECKATCDNCESLDVRSACKKGEHAPCGPCVNNGTCVDNHMNYTCQCVPGFSGQNCYQNIDDCVGKPCQNGRCIDGINKFTCDCYDGFSSVNCAHEINECTENGNNPCFGERPCTDLTASYKCSCGATFTGTRCERKDCVEGNNKCSDEQVCHSIDLARAEGESNVVRCVEKTHLATLEFETIFAPLSGDEMYSWKVQFLDFLSTEVKVPLAWVGEKKGDVLMNDVAIYEYVDTRNRYRRSTSEEETPSNMTTTVLFYGIVEDKTITPEVLLWSVNDTCDISYADCQQYNAQFKCQVCKVVSLATINLNRPTVSSSTGSPDDPLYLDILPIAGILISVILMITLGACIYKHRTNRFKSSRFDDDKYNSGNGYGANELDIMEQRSRTWNEHDLNHFAGTVNPMFGAGEEEVDSKVVNTSFKQINPDGTIGKSAGSTASRMFDNPLYGISGQDFDGLDDSFDGTNNTPATSNNVPAEEDSFAGFSNPTFFQGNPESEF